MKYSKVNQYILDSLSTALSSNCSVNILNFEGINVLTYKYDRSTKVQPTIVYILNYSNPSTPKQIYLYNIVTSNITCVRVTGHYYKRFIQRHLRKSCPFLDNQEKIWICLARKILTSTPNEDGNLYNEKHKLLHIIEKKQHRSGNDKYIRINMITCISFRRKG